MSKFVREGLVDEQCCNGRFGEKKKLLSECLVGEETCNGRFSG